MFGFNMVLFANSTIIGQVTAPKKKKKITIEIKADDV